MISSLDEPEETRFWAAVEALLEERKAAQAEGPRTWRDLAARMGLPGEAQLSNRRYAARRAQYRMRPMLVEGTEGVTVARVAAALDVHDHPTTLAWLLARAGIPHSTAGLGFDMAVLESWRSVAEQAALAALQPIRGSWGGNGLRERAEAMAQQAVEALYRKGDVGVRFDVRVNLDGDSMALDVTAPRIVLDMLP